MPEYYLAVHIFPAFREPRTSLPSSQKWATNPYHEPQNTSLTFRPVYKTDVTLLFRIRFLYI